MAVRLRANVFVADERDRVRTPMKNQQTRVTRGFRTLLFGVFCLVAAACTGGESASPAPEDTTTTSTTTTTVADPDSPEAVPVIDAIPTAPVGLVVTENAEGSVTLEWDESRDESVTGYEVTRIASIGSAVFEVTDPSFTDDELEDGDVVTYTVSAVNEAGTSDRSEPLPVQVGVDTNAPSRPGTPRTAETDEGVALSWRASTDFSGIDRYIVTRILDGETSELETPEPELVDDIAPGLTVTYAVRAVDGAGNESENTRNVTFLSGTAADEVVVVVSALADPAEDAGTTRLQAELLEAGFTVTWFEDSEFDSNLTTSEDLVLLIGDTEGPGFDWNLFGTDANTITLNSLFFVASGLVESFPRADSLDQIAYAPPGEETRFLGLTDTAEPRIPRIPQLNWFPDLEVWATPPETQEVAVAGLVPAGGELIDDREAPGCRAFFPGNFDDLNEYSDSGWGLLTEFVGSVSDRCR